MVSFDPVDVCSLDAIDSPGARGFSVEIDHRAVKLIVVRLDDAVLAYRNSCPHTGIALNWSPDRFFDIDGEYLQCSTHGALFRPLDGYCVAGPCAGQSLVDVPITVVDGRVVLRPAER